MGPDVLAAVDLGTNSFHLVVAKVEESRFEVIEREREMVRLGSSGGDMKRRAAVNARGDRGIPRGHREHRRSRIPPSHLVKRRFKR